MNSFQTLVKQYVEEAFRLFPTQALYMGIHDHDHELESFSKESRQETLRTIRGFERERSKIGIKELSADSQIDYLLMGVEIAGHEIFFEESRIWERDPVIYPETIMRSVYFLLLRNHTDERRRAEALLSRMKRFPGLLKEAKENLKNPPRILSESALEMTQGGIEFFKEIDFGRIAKNPNLRKELEKEKIKTLQAMQDYSSWLKDELLPKSKGDFAAGKDLFNKLLRKCHLLPYDAKDLKEIGTEAFRETTAQLKKLAKKIDPNQSWEEILRGNAQKHPTVQNLLSTYKKEAEKTRAFIVEKNLVPLPRNEILSVNETPSFYRPFLPFAAYMPPPPFQAKGNGEFWVTPIPTNLPKQKTRLLLQEHAFHKIPVIVLHETYPGHHVQFSFLRDNSSLLVKRSYSFVSCEGWAFYCEEMMREQGFYPNNLCELSQRRDELWRIARVLLDVGLHTERMKPQTAVSFLVNKVKMPEAMAWGEIKRYVLEATQPMSYFIGKREILKLREKFKKKLKDKFTLFRFHRELLKCGIIPIQLAEKKMLAAQ